MVYYIDSVGGNDANPGTSKGAPWARAPGMKNGSGVAHTSGFGVVYVPASGDQFIFKGGTTWLASYSWTISWPNTTWTTDPTWGSGAAVFDVQHSQSGNAAILLKASNITFGSGFDVRNAVAKPLGGGQETGTFGCAGGWSNIRITGAIIRDWWMVDPQQSSNTNGGAVFSSGGSNVTVDNCEVTQQGAGQITGQAFYGVSSVHHCNIHHINNCFAGGSDLHDNWIHDCQGTPTQTGGGDHQNTWTATGSGRFYNNLVYGLNGTNGPIQFNNVNLTCSIYNNVFYSTGGQAIITIHAHAASNQQTFNIYGNTLVNSIGGVGLIRLQPDEAVPFGHMTLRNNHMITNNGDSEGVVINAGTSFITYVHDHNLKQAITGTDTSGVTSAGYSASNNYQPTIGSAPTVDQGADLSSTGLPSITFDRLSVQRPQGNAWDIGAYEFGGPPGGPTISVNPSSLDWGSVAI